MTAVSCFYSRMTSAVVVTLTATLLTGCFSSSQDDLQSWMNEQKNQVKPSVKPIAEPKKFVPQPYDSNAQLDPFNNQRLTQALRQSAKTTAANEALIAPELARRKEALEAYPLDTATMIGSVNKGREMIGLVRVDKLVYQVKVGNYIGLNYGKITKITENQIVLREIAQDSSGDWTERNSQLELQERSK